jgi:hypothetical protein
MPGEDESGRILIASHEPDRFGCFRRQRACRLRDWLRKPARWWSTKWRAVHPKVRSLLTAPLFRAAGSPGGLTPRQSPGCQPAPSVAIPPTWRMCSAASCAGLLSERRQGLLKIGQQVAPVFNTHGNPYQAVCDAGLRQFLRAHSGVGRGFGMAG